MGNQKITVPDHRINGLKNEDGVSKSDTFIVDLDSFSSGLDKDSTTNATSNINSRITVSFSFSFFFPLFFISFCACLCSKDSILIKLFFLLDD